MSFSHRRLLLFEDEKSTHAVLHAKKYDCDLCFLNDRDCPDQCKNDLDLDDQVFPISPPPLIPSRNNGSNNNTNNMPTILIMMLCVLGAAFVFLCYLTILKRYRSNLSSSSRRRRRRDMDTDTGTADGNRRGDLMDENHGQMMINPIWYINTVGLQQSVIDSIAVFRYKKGESLIESGDCSVCLSEFEEDEMLRVLPKCSHAFHIDCIDTWLRSHKNCPLCRAPIVRESIILEAEEEEESVLPMSNNNNSVSPENTSADDDEEEVSDHRHSISTTNLPEIGEENITDYPTGTSVDKNNDGIRVLSDLSDHHHHHRRVRRTGEEELQPAAVRRSISMDAKIPPPVIQEEEEKLELKKQNSDKVTTELMIIHKHNKSRKSFSFGRSLQKMPIRMKRSFSSSSHNSNSKSSSLSRNRNSRSQEIIQSF